MIKIDMEMPKSCFKCRFELQDDLWGTWKCQVNQKFTNYDRFHPESNKEKRYCGCPLIEVKEYVSCGTCKNHPENKNRDPGKCPPCFNKWVESNGESMPNWEDPMVDVVLKKAEK